MKIEKGYFKFERCGAGCYARQFIGSEEVATQFLPDNAIDAFIKYLDAEKVPYTFHYENGCYETSDGFFFSADGTCLAEPGTDADFDTYAVEVQNGDGYYNSDGHFVRCSYE